MHSISVRSRQREEFIDITKSIFDILSASGIEQGLCVVFVPHTTAAVTINEHADPDVVTDILSGLRRLAAQPDYRHQEGNSDAHLKASLLGSSASVPVDQGRLVLGTWQGIFLAEFDGPRQRTVHLQIVPVPDLTRGR
ncbi:MAG: secondary thiamine-phosphate synthase enzyme YjbQ [Syntrophomonadaceae bacterium]